MPLSARRALIAVLTVTPAVVLGAFFAFVGWNKAFAPRADLASYHVWTLVLPEWAGRLVGWSEMALAAALLGALLPQGRQIARVSALLLILNQAVAAAVHTAQGEVSALPQNAVLALLLILLAILLRR